MEAYMTQSNKKPKSREYPVIMRKQIGADRVSPGIKSKKLIHLILIHAKRIGLKHIHSIEWMQHKYLTGLLGEIKQLQNKE